jgi:hypothetical protein
MNIDEVRQFQYYELTFGNVTVYVGVSIVLGKVPQITFNGADVPVVSLSYQYTTTTDKPLSGHNMISATVIDSTGSSRVVIIDTVIESGYVSDVRCY